MATIEGFVLSGGTDVEAAAGEIRITDCWCWVGGVGFGCC